MEEKIKIEAGQRYKNLGGIEYLILNVITGGRVEVMRTDRAFRFFEKAKDIRKFWTLVHTPDKTASTPKNPPNTSQRSNTDDESH